jgi:aspartate ammonia-lyase
MRVCGDMARENGAIGGWVAGGDAACDRVAGDKAISGKTAGDRVIGGEAICDKASDGVAACPDRGVEAGKRAAGAEPEPPVLPPMAPQPPNEPIHGAGGPNGSREGASAPDKLREGAAGPAELCQRAGRLDGRCEGAAGGGEPRQGAGGPSAPALRLERDGLGGLLLPESALYGIHSARARDNFDLGGRKTSIRLIYAIVKVKKAAAITYEKLRVGRDGVYRAVIAACDRALAGEADGMFIVDALQGGAGTSSHMNVNEVLANLALAELGEPFGAYGAVHPIDDVNRGQSTNDVYPTALRIAAIELLRELSGACAGLQQALQEKENEWGGIKKLGRTELMDAVPITLGAEFGAYAQAIARDRWRLYKMEERLRQVNIGGTAVGLSDGAGRRYRFMVIEELRALTGIGLAAAEYPMDITQNNDVFVEASGLMKALAVNLMKLSGDLRLMNSGPHGGLGEIRLAPMQAGSSIMPGKVNPVIPEMAAQVAMKVIANDLAVTMAAAHGEFELNAFLPLIADALLESLSLLSRAVPIFRERCVEALAPDRERCAALLGASYAFATAYAETLGYDAVSRIIAENGGDSQKIRDALAAAAVERQAAGERPEAGERRDARERQETPGGQQANGKRQETDGR